MKHTSIVLEPSKPFHTLVKLVDAENIENYKIRTHDVTLEVNSITNQLQSQPRDPNNKLGIIKLHIKNYHFVTPSLYKSLHLCLFQETTR